MHTGPYRPDLILYFRIEHHPVTGVHPLGRNARGGPYPAFTAIVGMMVPDIGVADGNMIFIKRVEMNAIGCSHIHTVSGVTAVSLRLAIHLLPGFATIRGFHGA